MTYLSLNDAALKLSRIKRIPEATARNYLVAGLHAGEVAAWASNYGILIIGEHTSSAIARQDCLIPANFWGVGHCKHGDYPQAARWPTDAGANWSRNAFRNVLQRHIAAMQMLFPEINLDQYDNELLQVELIATDATIDPVSVDAFCRKSNHRSLYETMMAGVGRRTRERVRDVDSMHARIVLSLLGDDDVNRIAHDEGSALTLVRAFDAGNVSEAAIRSFARILHEDARGQLTQSIAQARPPIV